MDVKKKKSILKVTVSLHLLQKHFTFFNESLMQVQVLRAWDTNHRMGSAPGGTCPYLGLRPCVSMATSTDVNNPPDAGTQTTSPAPLQEEATS